MVASVVLLGCLVAVTVALVAVGRRLRRAVGGLEVAADGLAEVAAAAALVAGPVPGLGAALESQPRGDRR